MELENSFGDYKINKIIKSDSCLVMKVKKKDNYYICKISNDNTPRLESEVSRIQSLKVYHFFKDKLPKIVDQGVIKNGMYKNRSYYIQEYFEGITLGDFIMNDKESLETKNQILKILVGDLVDISEQHNFDKTFDFLSADWLEDHILGIFNSMNRFEELRYLNSLNQIELNSKKLQNLKKCLDTIFGSNTFRSLNDEKSFISSLGHWNFHDQNIILDLKSNSEEYKIIDPDTKIDLCDPLFSLARLFYSFDHATIETGNYYIESNCYSTKVSNNYFNIKHTWKNKNSNHYAELFNSNTNSINSININKIFSNKKLYLRFQMNLIMCYLIGCRRNFEKKPEFNSANFMNFKKNDVYLFLKTLDIANNLFNILKENNE